MQNLVISLVQCSLFWEDPEKNLNHIEEAIFSSQELSDVIILPEMFTTGFTMSKEVIEDYSEDSTTIKWMKSIAKRKDSAVCGSVIMNENGNRKNRFIWVDNSQVIFYDKRHLFSYGSEHKHFKAGESRVIVEYKGWRILPQVCYDLRFPVFSRNSWINESADYDLMIYVANWPDVRIHAWDVLSTARAIENQCYVAVVNRVGSDGKGLNYVGHSALIDANGSHLIPPMHNSEELVSATIDKERLDRFRDRFPILKDGDRFDLSRK